MKPPMPRNPKRTEQERREAMDRVSRQIAEYMEARVAERAQLVANNN
jgi:hypothetical protein